MQRFRPVHALVPAAVLALGLALALAAPQPAAAAELAGVTLPGQVTVGDQDLVLNGLGLRKKFFIKVYVGGLYLPSKQSDPDAILGVDQPRRMVMHFLYDVDKGRICEAWNEGLEKNRPDHSDVVKAQFVDLCDLMVDFEEGDRMVLTYLPDEGTTIEIGGEEKGIIAGKPFADAVLSTWIGPEPPSKDLREGLLGR